MVGGARAVHAQRRSGRTGATGLYLVVLSLVLHVPGFIVGVLTSDEATAATVGRVLGHGGRLYADVADRKPPIVPYLYALVFRATGEVDIRMVRVIGALVLAAVAWMLASEAARRYGSQRVGLACGILFLLAYAAFLPGDSQAATFELFMLLPMTAAVVEAGQGRWLTAGLLLGVACLCKQTAATAALPIAFLLLRESGRLRACLGLLAAVVPVVTAAAMVGISQFWLWNVSGNGGYLAYQGSPAGTTLRALAMTGVFAATNIPLLALVLLSAAHRRPSTDLVLWTAGSAISVLAGLRFFGHYYTQLLPPLALVAAGAFPLLERRARRWVMSGAAATAGLMMVLTFVPLGDNATIPWHVIAARVRAAAAPGATVFVWGDLPEVYLASGRDPATRFVRTGFLTGNSGGRANGSGSALDGIPGAWSMLESDLRAHPPALIVDTSSTPIRQADYYPLDRSPIGAYVATNYRVIATVDGVRLLQADALR